MLSQLKLAPLHIDLKKFDLLISRTAGQKLIPWGKLYFQNIVIMCLDNFMSISLRHMLGIAIDNAFIISDSHSLQVLTHSYRSNAVIGLYFHLFFPC